MSIEDDKDYNILCEKIRLPWHRIHEIPKYRIQDFDLADLFNTTDSPFSLHNPQSEAAIEEKKKGVAVIDSDEEEEIRRPATQQAIANKNASSATANHYDDDDEEEEEGDEDDYVPSERSPFTLTPMTSEWVSNILYC
jgi:hypothetical protein